ncbi:MAG: DUF4124 domain-containing protein [Methylococcaceae bacterium]|nr:DUF4124 domain-containing protein [Methylococcaceae bacterium]
MRSTLLILGSLFAINASAGVYKCTDANGKTDYRSAPCEAGHSAEEINIKTGGSTNLDKEEQKQQLELQAQEQKQTQEQIEQEQAKQKLEKLKQDSKNESAKNQFQIKSNPDKFSAFAIPPYNYDSLPTLVKDYQSRLPDVERFRRQAADKALATKQCNRVESVELSSKSTQTALVFSVDCSTGKNFIFSEQDLSK